MTSAQQPSERSPSAPADDGAGVSGPDPSSPAVGPAELHRLLHIEIPVIAVLAEKTMRLREVLNLTIGSVIQLDKPVDEPLDLLLNNQRIGTGRTVRVGDNFGLQLDQLNPVDETIRKLARPTPEASPSQESNGERS